MCCSVQMSQVEKFLVEDQPNEDKPRVTKSIVKPNTQTVPNKDTIDLSSSPTFTRSTLAEEDENKNKIDTTQTCDQENIGENVATKEQKKKGKKKWKSLPLTNTGFVISLFPRPPPPSYVDPEEENRVFQKIENDLEDQERILDKYPAYEVSCMLKEGVTKGTNKLLRIKKKMRIRKAGKQVKDKHCMNVKNNKGGKKLFIHHRLSKIINMEVQRLSYLPSPRNRRNEVDAVANNKSQNSNRSRLKTTPPAPLPPRAQNLHHALHTENAPSDIGADIVSVLINLQHRELTPEDYDLLCRLDESVAPKTLDKGTVSSFKSDIVDESCAGDICPVCMECYEIGQQRRFLPCQHVFHGNCIEMWLENSSRNCPIDGLPVDT